MKAKTLAAKVEVSPDGEGLISHAGGFLLTELADRLGLTEALTEAMAPARQRRSAHDPGVVLRDLAVAIADGGDCVTDLGVLAGQQDLFGHVASTSTAHRVIGSIDAECLEAIRAARAKARTAAWAAGSNTATDHFEVLAGALEQIPGAGDPATEILARCDGGGATHAFTADCREAKIAFSVGYELSPALREALLELPESAWHDAIEAGGEPREGAWVAELTDLIDIDKWPD